jgi:integrase
VIVGTLSSIFAAALDDGVVQRNPVRARSVKLPPKPGRRIVPWTPEMVTVAAAELGKRKDAAGMVWLAVIAGLREGEVFAFAEEDIQFLGSDRHINVRRQVKRVGKTLVFAPPPRAAVSARCRCRKNWPSCSLLRSRRARPPR